MALRGLNGQIMVRGALDLTGESARLLRQNELQTEQAHAQARRQAMQDAKRTMRAGTIRGSRLSPEERGPGCGANPRKRDQETTPDLSSEFLDLPVEQRDTRRIDISV